MAKGRRIVEGVWWVGCGSWGGLTDVLSAEGSGNVFLIGGAGDWALIDAGKPDGVDAVLANAADAGAKPADIARIVLTHSHGDHALGLPALKAATGAVAAAAPLAADALAGDARARETLFIRQAETVDVEEVLADGDEVALGPHAFTCLHTPGHIPDAITLVGDVGGRAVAVTGDTAIGDQGGIEGVHGWLDGHWHSNPRRLLASIGRIADRRCDLMLPGHGRPIVGRDAVEASLRHCADRLRRLLAIPGLGSMMPLDLDGPDPTGA